MKEQTNSKKSENDRLLFLFNKNLMFEKKKKKGESCVVAAGTPGDHCCSGHLPSGGWWQHRPLCMTPIQVRMGAEAGMGFTLLTSWRLQAQEAAPPQSRLPSQEQGKG